MRQSASSTAGERRDRAILTSILAIAPILVIGGWLRVYRFDHLSLWLDEGFTIAFSRLPWTTVLGLHGAYDPHPPLYYALVKAAALVVSDLRAGRLVSVVAGTLTIPALFVLAERLVDRCAAIVAAGALAISPLHLWYSQEARQYALVTLLVTLSYLALVLSVQAPAIGWAITYSATTAAAMYVDYAAFFALAPQLAIIAIAVSRRRPGSPAILLGCAAAIAVFLPWVPELLESERDVGSSRSWYLGVSADRVREVALALLGLNRSYFWGVRSAWDIWPYSPALLIAGIAPAIVGGLVVLRRHGWLAMGATLGLLLGTVLVAALASVASPSFAERTVLPALVGWCLLLGAAARVRSPVWLTALCLPSLILILGASLVTDRAVLHGDKQHWRDLARDTAIARSDGYPIVTIPTIADTLITLYEPDALGANHIVVSDGSELPPEMFADASGPPALWLAYIETPTSARVREQIIAHGYERREHLVHRDALFLDLFVRADATP